MARAFGFTVDTTEMQAVLRDIERESTRTDDEIVTFNAQRLVREIAFHTPHDTGGTKAGWTAAWDALRQPGTPAGTRRRPGTFFVGKKKKREYHIESGVEDNRGRRGNATFDFWNRSRLKRNGRWFNYAYVFERQDHWMQDAVDSATFKFGEQ
ncbi:MAG: hypothetical protein HQ582_18220 [Planctomycetes bacterium]|nr:hypothetical protein [Planctomycetota bacterium]